VLGRADVEIILRSGGPVELLTALETLNLDMVLTTQTPQRDAVTSFVSHPVAEQAVSLVGVPARLDKQGDLAAMLREQPVILPTMETSIRPGFDALADRLGVRPQIAAEVDDMAMMRLLAREGVGLAVLPPIVVQDELASGLLVEATRLRGIVESFIAVTMERRFPNPIVGELLEAARTADKGDLAQG